LLEVAVSVDEIDPNLACGSRVVIVVGGLRRIVHPFQVPFDLGPAVPSGHIG
jgi:hypothetical protein